MASIREQKIQELDSIKQKGFEPYPHKFEREMRTGDIIEKYDSLEAGQTKEDDTVKTAGRIVAMRDHGKSAFF